MKSFKRSQVGGVVSALLLCVAWAAHAQDSATTNTSSNSSSGPVLGPPALKDFQLEPRERLVTQPAPPPIRPPATAQPQPLPSDRPVAARPRPAARPADPPAESRSARPNRSTGRDPSPAGVATPSLPATRNEAEIAPLPSPPGDPVATAPVPAQGVPASPTTSSDRSPWLYLVPLIALLIGGVALLRRRKLASGHEVDPAPVEPRAAVVATPRMEAAARPWLELDLKAQRASYTDAEWVVQFELSVSNTGPIPARNLRIDVMLFNAVKEQDKEISAFFRTAGRESTKLNLDGVQPGQTGVIDGEVAMPLAEMRAMKLSDRTLFIPVVAVNGLYEWGESGNGQTAKSYIVGRELQEPADKMGAFRLDLGPRIWRMVGQRPHKLARRF